MSTPITAVIYSSPRTFTCQHPGCNKPFSSKFSLTRHQGIHCNTKTFICNYCGKKFAIAQYLKEHSYCHTKDKFYVCKIGGCQKSFRHASDVSLHRRTHPEFQVRRYRYMQQSGSSDVKKTFARKFKVIRVRRTKEYVKEKNEKLASTADLNLDSLIKSIAKNVSWINITQNDEDKISMNIQYIRYLKNMCEGKDILEPLQLPQPWLFKGNM